MIFSRKKISFKLKTLKARNLSHMAIVFNKAQGKGWEIHKNVYYEGNYVKMVVSRLK